MTRQAAKTDPVERRPLQARNAGFWIPLAYWLTRRGVTPNGVSMVGLLVGLLSGALLAATGTVSTGLPLRVVLLLAVVAVLCRGACNILDGVMAVETGHASPLGTLWNEVPDRISDAATLVGAGYALGSDPILGWAAALVAVLVAYVRAQCRVAGAPMDYSGPMAKPMRMAMVCAASLWLAATPAVWRLQWGPSRHWGVMALALVLVIVGGAATVVRRLSHAAKALAGGRA